MKLIAVMSIEEYAGELRKIFSEHRVPVFSETEINGYKLLPEMGEKDNWFSGKHTAVYSHIVFAFVEAQKADELLSAIQEYCKQRDCANPIRAFQLSVEKFV
ncbi:hypothetical protein K1X84_00775 [bacterium]|nr:hypothetical protein [bacterium]